MAGLELLYTCNRDRIICADDAVVFLVHWVLTTAGYRCIGSGNQQNAIIISDERPELLPSNWNSRRTLYHLRYRRRDSDAEYELICAGFDPDLFLFIFEKRTPDLEDRSMRVKISDHVNADQLQTFSSVYKDVESLSQRIGVQLLHTAPGGQPHWLDPLWPPFGDDGADIGPDPDP